MKLCVWYMPLSSDKSSVQNKVCGIVQQPYLRTMLCTLIFLFSSSARVKNFEVSLTMHLPLAFKPRAFKGASLGLNCVCDFLFGLLQKYCGDRDKHQEPCRLQPH